VVIVDNFLTGTQDKIPTSKHDNIRFIRCDVNNYVDLSTVMISHQFEFVFHYAAVVGVQRTLDNPVMVLSDLHGFRNVLELSKNSGVKRVFFSSSSEVYGEPVELPQNEETTPLNSRLPYAIVKNAGEAYLRSYQKEYGLSYTIFRFFNTYGPKQSKDFVISRFLAMALSNQDIVVNGDGKQTRTFCYIDDNTEACLNAFYRNEFVNDVVNIGSDKEITIRELADVVIAVTGSKSKVVFGPSLSEGDMTRRMPDTRKMSTLLNKTPLTLEEGLRKILSDTKYIL
ncbi:MAG TPA: NAD-dependent epimerase/dehydratase family protein, partial [Bacteroidia bacterium]|nr:NAD-dependent epimerase/dehydratase family protein [Bacteroidia bacterium]